MFVPFIILLGGLIVARELTKGPENPLIRIGTPRVVTGAVSQTQGTRDNRNNQDSDSPLPPNMQRLIWALKSGMSPDRWIIDAAISEAYQEGRWDIVQKLTRRFPHEISEAPSSENPNSDVVGTVIGKNSPFEGVSNDDWNRFVDKLATQDDGYKTEKHVGRYHHSRARLQQLGIDPDSLCSGDRQYEALVTDLSDSGTKAQDLISDFLYRPITLSGQDISVTMSGLLMLIKAAGPSQARSWLENDSDRSQFPKTTEMFLSTNGIF